MKRNQLAVFIGLVAVCAVIGYVYESKSTPPANPAPLGIGFRPSINPLVHGLVLQVQNKSGNYVSCAVGVTNTTVHEFKKYAFSLDPYKSTEVGTMEMGWSFEHGEQVLIKTEGYDDVYGTVP